MMWCQVDVSVAYVQPIEVIECPSRFLTRCLKLRVDPPRTDLVSTIVTRSKKEKNQKLPGEPLTDAEGEDELGFSDTEEEIAAMEPDHQKVYKKVKERMKGDHRDDEDWGFWDDDDKIYDKCFQAAAERIMPSHGSEFTLRNKDCSHDWANLEKYRMAYIQYVPSYCEAEGSSDMGDYAFYNVPWGRTLTPMRLLKDEERAQVDAAFAVLVEKLGLTAKGKASQMLISDAFPYD
jgi:hypothetical protein